jgi:uncharacterized protein YjaZ
LTGLSRELLELLELPVRERATALGELLKPMYAHVPIPGDPVDLPHPGGGVRVDRDDERYRAWEALTEAVPGIRGPESLQVVLILGNPDDHYLTGTAGGYYGMGGVPGWIYLLAWPSDEVIGRIAHCAVHEFHHQVRYHNVEWNPMTVTVGEHIVAEGLAEAFVRELSGVDAMGPWSKMVTGNDFDRAYAKILADAGLAGMRHTSAYVLGDTAAQKFGQQPVGIPDMAGYTTLPGVEILRHTKLLA